MPHQTIASRLFWFGVSALMSISGRIALFYALRDGLGWKEPGALGTSLACVYVFTFIFSQRVIFRSDRKWHESMPRYVAVVLSAYVIEFTLSSLAFHLLPGAPRWFLMSGALALNAAYKFLMFHFWVFPRSTPRSSPHETDSPAARRFRVGVALLAAGVGIALFVHRLQAVGDGLDYILMAKAILAGDWAGLSGWRYPPVYPATLALATSLTGMDFGGELLQVSAFHLFLLKSLGLAFLAAGAIAVLAWSRGGGFSLSLAATVAALTALNQHIAVTGSILATEALFCALFWTALARMDRCANAARRRDWWLLAALMTGAIFTRPVGLALSVGCGLHGVLRMLRSRSVRPGMPWVLVASATTLLYAVYSQLGGAAAARFIGGGTEYYALEYDTSTAVWMRALHHAGAFFPRLSTIAIPKLLGADGVLARAGLAALDTPLTVVWMALALVGVYAACRDKLRPSWLALAAYAGVICTTLNMLGRYFLPLVPALLLLSLAGGQAIAARLPLRAAVRTGCARAAAGFLLLWFISTTALPAVKNWRNIVAFRGLPPWAPERYIAAGEPQLAALVEASLWIANQTPEGTPVLASKAPLVELISAHPARHLQQFETSAQLLSYLQSQKPDCQPVIIRDTLSSQARAGRRRDLLLEGLTAGNLPALTVRHSFENGVDILTLSPDRENPSP
ncbi:MAG TPA: hypothetical protein PKE12_00340 [Kiritimatiellia bacterium]|nr:hypothetical protein [Kiritimatiellia bacterium]